MRWILLYTAVWVLNDPGTVAGSDLKEMAECTTESGQGTGVPSVVLRAYLKDIHRVWSRLGRRLWEDDKDMFFGVFIGYGINRALLPFNGYFPCPSMLRKVFLADVWHFFGSPTVSESASNAQVAFSQIDGAPVRLLLDSA